MHFVTDFSNFKERKKSLFLILKPQTNICNLQCVLYLAINDIIDLDTLVHQVESNTVGYPINMNIHPFIMKLNHWLFTDSYR